MKSVSKENWLFLMKTNIGNSFVLAHILVPICEEERLQRLSQYLWDDFKTRFCTDPVCNTSEMIRNQVNRWW
ncbi:MAG: hypothetical protein AYK19_08905 [Theionarchaea archaeon DG-70-1]|nr:MAG: hypothetical protein AYK19_08905 [Theionarchaea archaeon DG-70-1]